MLKLTVDQKTFLEIRLREAKEASERNRLRVVLGYNDGLAIEDLAKALRIGRATVYNYLKDFDSEQKIKNDSRGGADSNAEGIREGFERVYYGLIGVSSVAAISAFAPLTVATMAAVTTI